MNCRQCGAPLAPDDLVCGVCGTIADTLSVAQPTLSSQPTVAARPVTSSRPGAAPRPAAAPRSTAQPQSAKHFPLATVLIILFACSFVGLIALGALGGVWAGLQDRQADEQARAEKYYQEGIANRAAGKLLLAKADFEYVLKLNPIYPGAREQLTLLQDLLTVRPTPTFVAEVNVAAQLYQAGLDAYEKREWLKAIQILAQLRAINPTYEQAGVAQTIYNAALTYGQDLLQDNRLEEGLTYLEQAAYIKPLPAEAETAAQYARLYITARDYWNVNWQKAIESFGELYQVAPGYQDTFARYVEAHILYGDERTRAGDPCAAQPLYEEANQLRPADALQAKAEKAKQDCLTMPPSITGTNQTLAGLYAGRIAYPVYDENGARILAASAGDQQIFTAAIGDQPEWQRNGGRFAHRVAGGGAYVVDNGSANAIAPAGAEFPTFAPDGSRVIYALGGQLYMVNADGSGEPIGLGAGSAPTWGPNGLLAYSGCDDSGCGILIRNPDTGDAPQRLTGSSNDIPTSWSPDGFNISYYSNVGGNYDLFFVNTAGGVQQVTSNAGNNVGGGWGPDGAHVAFLSDRDGTWSLYLARYDGTEATKIALAPQGDWTRQRVSWVP
jgi:tetratricopeptide (TPR) repeat protein